MVGNENSQPVKRLALRLDDAGAASKRNEVYANWRWRCGPVTVSGDWLLLKYLPPFRRWGVYREITGDEWREVFSLLEEFDARLTVAVTAAWVEHDGSLVPFPEKFPAAAAALKEGQDRGLIEIANHGLTHCVLANNAFKPKWFTGNRRYHREFWDWIPAAIHEANLRRSQDILRTFFQTAIVTFVPPGNVFTVETVRFAYAHGLRYLSCNTSRGVESGMRLMGNGDTLAFHDRDIVLGGVEWLRQQLMAHQAEVFCTVHELGESIEWQTVSEYSARSES